MMVDNDRSLGRCSDILVSLFTSTVVVDSVTMAAARAIGVVVGRHLFVLVDDCFALLGRYG